MKICTNCLRHPDEIRCLSKYTCEICNKFHNTLLHLTKNEKPSESETSSISNPSQTLNQSPANVISPSTLACRKKADQTITLLSTAEALVKDSEGENHV
ncbi:hypothetical protein ILUMI_15367, partial [Ignelater luminosus]